MSNPVKIESVHESDDRMPVCADSLDAFEQLVRLHAQELRQFLFRRVKDKAVSDDIAQEVLIAAFQKYVAGSAVPKSFRAWLFSVARNKLVDYWRKLAREKAVVEGEFEDWVVQEHIRRCHTAEPSPELMEALEQCLEELGPKAQALVQANYFQGQTAEEIAKMFQQKGNSVRMALLRIRKTLAKCIRRRLGREIEL